jgi:hypothetical protein
VPSITTTASPLPSGGLIQNLGPDEIYVGESSAVTSSTGVRVSADEVIAVGFVNLGLYAVSAGTSDVRTLTRGTGIFPTVTPA